MDQRDDLLYEEAALSRVFHRRRTKIREWITGGYLPARTLPDGRVVVLREELLDMLRNLPRVDRVQRGGDAA